MEEELNENDLEERLYSMLHYADDTQVNLNANQKDAQIIENAPRSTVRRYWRTNEESSVYQKINNTKLPPTNKNTITKKTDSKSKEEKRAIVPSTPSNDLLSIFQSPVSQNLKKTIEIIENHEEETQVVALVSSDEDEVIEVALPPKPTITIESSDEEEVCAIEEVMPKDLVKDTASPEKKSPGNERDGTASPVPSVVSSVSDEFIRGDCIALNISSRHPNNESFDFSLHGSDLLVQTPSKKKKKKKNKNTANTSTPIASATPNVVTPTIIEECFATPKSKAKNKKQKNKSYLVSAQSLPNPDVYDSDSNQSGSDLNKNQSNSDPGKTLGVSQIDPNISANLNLEQAMTKNNTEKSERIISKDELEDSNMKTPKETVSAAVEATNIIDLTKTSDRDLSVISIDKNLVMGNVTGFSGVKVYDMTLTSDNTPKLGSTNVPDILYADLDFNNLNGKDKVSKKRRYSLTTLRAEMEKFYNESWGGENFNHREIQKYMSRDKSLWVIDPKDRISAFTKRKVTCNYCNRQGHRDDTCRMKPLVCYMCGSMGHKEPRCPRKICVNCGSPNHMYSSMCRNCCNWRGVTCAECGQSGHPASHCPDLWRRYHNTISEDTPLEESHQLKKHYQMFCSGCTRRGHLVHNCRSTVPFSGLPINSPYVTFYNPVYPPTNANQSILPTDHPATPQNKNFQQDEAITSGSAGHRIDRNKRQSQSPVVHETHVNKKRNLSGSEVTDNRANTKSPANNGQKRKSSQSKDELQDVETNNKDPIRSDHISLGDAEKAPDFIPICTGNHDKQGQMIQDNEVSDTSDVVTSAKIFVTEDVVEKLNAPEGLDWLAATAKKNNVCIEKTDIIKFFSIKGTVGDQEAFQTELRDWLKNRFSGEFPKSDSSPDFNLENDQSLCNNIPKHRTHLLRVINNALHSLKTDIGDPKTLYKKLSYLQNRHLLMLKKKAITPKQLSNNRSNINSIFRKLNMILLGQAGLADGPKHLDKLCFLHEKITNFRQNIIPTEMRQEIGQHFHSIFTATPREDYADLLSEYYIKTQLSHKNGKSDKKKLNEPKLSKNRNNIFQDNTNVSVDKMSGGDIVDFKNSQRRSKAILNKTIAKLVFYHRRILNARPVDVFLKKTRALLVSRLGFYMTFLGRKTNVSSKSLKKARKIQEQAQLFLTNV